jgi:hypothetical protein
MQAIGEILLVQFSGSFLEKQSKESGWEKRDAENLGATRCSLELRLGYGGDYSNERSTTDQYGCPS